MKKIIIITALILSVFNYMSCTVEGLGNLTEENCNNNGSCDNGETIVSCPADCSDATTASCGDGVCNGSETTATCASDCGESCGDGVCNGSEGNTSCATDCPIVCGDGRIEGTEVCDDGNTTNETACNYGTASCTTCNADCTAQITGLLGEYCGDTVCNGGETNATCAADCPPVCGDGICNGNETSGTCPGDCISAGDTTPPEVTSVSISGTPTGPTGKYTYGDVITVSADITDAGVGVGEVFIALRNSFGNLFGSCSAYYVSGNTYSCSLTITDNTINGDEYIRISVYDNNWTYDRYYLDSLTSTTLYVNYTIGLTAVPITYVPIEEPAEVCGDGYCTGTETEASCIQDCDSTPPEVLSASISGTPTGPTGKYTYGDVITVSADITDAGSGVYYVYFELYNSNGGWFDSCYAYYVSGSTYSCTITITDNTINGDEYIFVSATDNKWNSDSYYLDSLTSTTHYVNSAGLTSVPITYVQIEEPVQACGDGYCTGTETEASCIQDCDSTPPEVLSVSISGTPSGPTGKYTYGDVITVSADITDAGVGVNTVYFDLYNSNWGWFGSCYAYYVSGNTYSCSLTISGNTIIGDEYIRVSAEDYNGNYDNYYLNSWSSTAYYQTNTGLTSVPITYVPIE
ncbi:MAG: hypothetical protein OEZ22_05345 [Spirochaetia bacterium]|nr:hypothetical protein [Spirochaetia bacterium]